MKRSASLALFSLLLALLVSACGGGGTASLGSGDVLVVGGQNVSKDDLSAMMNRAKASYKANKQKFPKPGTQEFSSLQGQAVTYLLQRAELAQRANDLGVKVSNKTVDDRINLVKKQSYGNDQTRFEAALKQQGLTLDQYKTFEKFQLISEEVYKKVTSKVHVSDSAIKDYYTKNKSVYQQKESRDVRHILVNKKSLADQIYAQLVAAHETNFAKLAKKYSKDPSSAKVGGKLTITKGQTVPEFDKVAFQLKTNEISPPVHTQYGWHIIQALSAVKPAKVTPLASVKQSIESTLLSTKKSNAMNAWVNQVKKDYAKKVVYAAGYTPSATTTATTSTTG